SERRVRGQITTHMPPMKKEWTKMKIELKKLLLSETFSKQQVKQVVAGVSEVFAFVWDKTDKSDLPYPINQICDDLSVHPDWVAALAMIDFMDEKEPIVVNLTKDDLRQVPYDLVDCALFNVLLQIE